MKHFNVKKDQHIQNTISTIKKISQDSININELLSEIKPNDNLLLSAQESIQENLRILTFYFNKCEQLLEEVKVVKCNTKNCEPEIITEFQNLTDNYSAKRTFVNKNGKITTESYEI